MIVLWWVLGLAAVRGDPLVTTSRGPIRGQDEGNYTTFLGVPYALVDEFNPFGKSHPYPQFTTPFEASNGTVKCPQAAFTPSGIIQCLRLNIYVPKTANRRLPVLIWFHGGGFVFGSAGDYDGKYLAQQEIIVVAANYRLGPYGFLCLDREEIPGNQGLKDQVDAMKWVRDNIAAFGGDPMKVTIAGESYGGGSVELHLYSEFEKYFDKAIIQSGGINENGILVKSDNKAAWNLAKILKPDVKRQEAIPFLAQADPIAVMKAFNSSGVLLRVCKEKNLKNKGIQNFLTDDSAMLYAPEVIKITPILIGYNSKETFADFMRLPDDYYENKAPNLILEWLTNNFKLNESEMQKAVDSVKRFYFNNEPITNGSMLGLVEFTSDFLVNHPEERAVTRFLNQSGTVYKYLFSYTGNSPYKSVKGVGAYHTEELQYLFDWVDVPYLSGDDNLIMRTRMTEMWANFVKYGNPTPHTSESLPVRWQRANQKNRAYLNIELDMKMNENVYQQRVAFWDTFWEMYGKNHILRG